MSKYQDVTDGLVPIILSGYTMNTGKLLGRSSPAPGDIQEITLGTGLALTGNVLSSSGGAGGVTSVGLVAPDIFTVTNSPVVTSGNLTFTPTDPNADRLVFWDDSASKWAYLTAGTGLSISGTTITATATGTVTSVALSVVNDDTRTVSGSPVTGTGTLTDTAVDAGSDKFKFWDDSAGKVVYGTFAGSLAISGTVLQDYQWLAFRLFPIGTTLVTGAPLDDIDMPACTVLEVQAGVSTVSSSGTPTFDIKESGTTILSTLITIDASELHSSTAATPAVISDATIANWAKVSFHCTVAGTGTKGGVIYMKVRWL